MPEAPAPVVIAVEFTAEELELVKTALRLLRATLGREEADELDEVRALIERLEVHPLPSAG